MRTKSSSKILISIINWNNSDATNRCLNGFLTIPNCPDILLIDNNSQSEALKVNARLLEKLPIKLQYNDDNLGFGGAHNKSIEYANVHGYDYVCLLNNDTEIIDTNIFESLAKTLSSCAGATGVAPVILSALKPDTIWYAGGSLDLAVAENHHNHAGELFNKSNYPTVEDTTFITGCCVMMRAGQDILFDASYFLYWEDADWSAKVLKNGEKLLFDPTVKLLHHTSTSLGARSPKYAYYNIRNHLLFAKKWSPSGNYKRIKLSIFIIATKYVLLSFKKPSSILAVYAHIRQAFSDGKNNITGEIREGL